MTFLCQKPEIFDVGSLPTPNFGVRTLSSDVRTPKFGVYTQKKTLHCGGGMGCLVEGHEPPSAAGGKQGWLVTWG